MTKREDAMEKERELEVMVSSIEGAKTNRDRIYGLRVELMARKTKETYSIIIDLKRRDFFIGDKYTAVLKSHMSPDFLGDDPKTMKIGTCSYEVDSLINKKGAVVYKKLEN